MNVLDWTKPRFISEDHWNALAQMHQWARPASGYVATLKKTDGGAVHVEIRKNFPSAQLLLVVALDGWNYNHDRRDKRPNHYGPETRGYTVRLSSNAALWGTVEDLRTMAIAGEEALEVLKSMVAMGAIGAPA